MGSPTPTVPDLDMPTCHFFIAALGRENVRPARGMTRQSYENDGRPIFIPVKPFPGYRELKCWYNALQHATENGGRPIFGWAIWKYGDEHFFAQHHAVWRSNQGDYVDVTPNGGVATRILFVPDGRAPFDYLGYRRPYDFRMQRGLTSWTAIGAPISDVFAIGRLSPSEEEMASNRPLFEAAAEAGILPAGL